MGKWIKKNKRHFYKPTKGERRKYTIGGDYIFLGVSEIDEKKYTRLHKLEKKTRREGLTTTEKKRFKELEKWNKKTEKKYL